MKKILPFIFLFSFQFILSQEENSQTFRFMLTAGVTASQIHGDNYSGFHKLGGMGGIGVEYQFSKKFASSLGLIFIQKGARKNQNPTKGDYSAYYMNLNYIEVPLIFTYKQKNKFLVDIGISAAYLASYYEANEVAQIIGNTPKNMDYSIKLGLGYQFNPKWQAHVRSSNSFITIRPYQTPSKLIYNNIIAQQFNKGLYNNILEIALTYKFIPKKNGE